jgi:hypothetical protein
MGNVGSIADFGQSISFVALCPEHDPPPQRGRSEKQVKPSIPVGTAVSRPDRDWLEISCLGKSCHDDCPPVVGQPLAAGRYISATRL